MAKFIRQHKIEIAIFFLAILARLAFFLISLHNAGWNVQATIHGEDGYFDISRNLILGHGFSINPTPPYFPYSYGVPVYPYLLYFLLWLTKSYTATIMVQMLLGAAISIIGIRMTRLMLPSAGRNISYAVGILLALAPYQILFSFIFYTEIVFTVIFCLFLILFFKFLQTPTTRLAIWSGLLLGISTLTKLTVEYLSIAAVLFALYHFRKHLSKDIFLKLFYFVMAFLVILSPWVYRNYKIFNTANLGSQMPFNLYQVLLPSVLAIENHSDFATEQNKLHYKAADIMFDLAVGPTVSHIAISQISHYPVALVKLSALNAFTFFTHDGMLTFLGTTGIGPASYSNLAKPALLLLISSPVQFARTVWSYMGTSLALVFVFRLFWILVSALFLLGLYGSWRKKIFTSQLGFAAIVVLYFMLTTMINGLTVNARFRMPVEPIILAVACIGAVFVYQFFASFAARRMVSKKTPAQNE